MADDKPQNADFIGRVVSDAKHPPETRMLTGWFGDSSEEGYRRLYTDAELNNYIDIPDDAILYSEPLRDAQPSGCVMVWIKRDADVKQGGSAASRAARFLQGQVQQDFASAGAAGSLDKAGLRCITVAPCGEPTGFTGQCTKQPDVGGAWPCITAIPHCYEVTGFTGKCTQAPWPNPTRYIGCTILHCPTHDLTHIPHICNIVASGQPGCVVVNPPQGGDPALKVDAAEVDEKAAPETSIPGCGYTKTWGVCETHFLGCGAAAQDNPQAAYITSICAPTAFCHVSQNCGGAAAQPASAICATAIGCDITVLCHTRFRPLCFPTLNCPTQPQQCFPIPSPFCPATQGCPFGPGGGGTPVQGGGGGFAAFAAAANPNAAARIQPGDPIGTLLIQCNPSAFDGCPSQRGCTQLGCQTQPVPECPSAIDGCPTRINCETQVPTAFCTQFPAACQTNCGPLCQTQQLNCTQFACTQAGPQCPTQPGAVCPTSDCTQAGPQCPTQPAPCPSQQFVCTQSPQCQFSPLPNCMDVQNPDPIAAQAFAAPAGQAPRTPVGCPPASGFNCPSQFGCQSIACQQGGGQQQVDPAQAFAAFGAARPAAGGAGGTQFPPQCPGPVFLPRTFVNCYTIPPYPGCYSLPPRCTPVCPTAGSDFRLGCTFANACQPTLVFYCFGAA